MTNDPQSRVRPLDGGTTPTPSALAEAPPPQPHPAEPRVEPSGEPAWRELARSIWP